MSSKKKLKKKKRIGALSVGGNPQTVANTLAQVQASQNGNTVNGNHEKPPAVDLDEWEDGDEEEDSEIDQTVDTGIVAEIAVVVIPPADQSQNNADRNTVEETNLENQNMNVVNHPQVTQAPVAAQATAPVQNVTEHTNLVPEGAMEQMQQDAANTPPAAATAPAPTVYPEVTTAPVAKTQAAFHNIAMTVMFTLDMTNFEYMPGLKNALSRVPLDGQEFNLYSPFRKAGKKAETNPAAEGVIRYALSGVLDITDTINNSRVMVVGPASEIDASLKSAIDTTRNQITNLFPADFETTIAEIRDEENRQTVQLQLKDIVNVRSWTNSSNETEAGQNETIASHNAVINITVNAGMLYDAEERTKYINQIEKVLQLVNNNREEANTTLLLAVNLDSASLSDPAMRELLDALLTTEEFILYTRNELHKLEVSDFLPQSKESVDRDLLTPNGDLLLIRLLTADEDEAESADDATGVEGAGVE